MIYTVTFNPALDYVIAVDHFAPGKINRTKEETMVCGGKGIRIEDPERLDEDLSKALRADGPAIIEIMTNPEI